MNSIRTLAIVGLLCVSCSESSKKRTQPIAFIDGSGTLYSENYKVNIEHDCLEGCVSCDNIRLVLYNNNTKEVSEHVGSTWHTTGSDGVTPSRFLGYVFEDDNKTYRVMNNVLQIIQDEDIVLVEEELKSRNER